MYKTNVTSLFSQPHPKSGVSHQLIYVYLGVIRTQVFENAELLLHISTAVLQYSDTIPNSQGVQYLLFSPDCQLLSWQHTSPAPLNLLFLIREEEASKQLRIRKPNKIECWDNLKCSPDMKTYDLVYQLLWYQSQWFRAHFTYFLFLID